ncbi:unnamed protein product [Dibothriocephalus latus]|uniref:Retinol dehydrogenase 14 n=1 Tax=Dibothriocephalus latus TaxID=60516 RepID=A0A3P7NGM2_DIBLA|nr:unnamed protein product [Dibothriocephalus latus]
MKILVSTTENIASFYDQIDTTDMNLRGKKYGRWKAYSQSKLANVIHARQLAQRHKDEGIIAVSVHPGVVKTELYKGRFVSSLTRKTLHFTVHLLLLLHERDSRPFMKNEWEGAQTTVYAVLAPDLENGGYYADCAPASINRQAQDDSICAKVWEMSCKTVGLDSPDN